MFTGNIFLYVVLLYALICGIANIIGWVIFRESQPNDWGVDNLAIGIVTIALIVLAVAV